MPTPRALTAADGVSLSRLLLAAAFVMAGSAAIRLGLIVAAGISDWLDGWIARRRDETSPFGAIVDPAADRVFIVVVIVTLVAEGTLTPMQTLILLARDIVTTVGVVVVRLVARLRSLRLEARFSGKVVTVLQFAALVGALVDRRTLPWMLALVALAGVISIADYASAAWRARTVAAVAVLLGFAPTPSHAQGFPGGASSSAPSRIRTEVRVDAFAARADAVHAGFGWATDLGTYVRLAGVLGAGVAHAEDRTAASGRVEVTGRFLLDPFRQARWGLYGATGIMARHDDGPGTRGYMTLALGLELPSERPGVTAVELGIGGGVRVAVAIRQGRRGRR